MALRDISNSYYLQRHSLDRREALQILTSLLARLSIEILGT